MSIGLKFICGPRRDIASPFAITPKFDGSSVLAEAEVGWGNCGFALELAVGILPR
jgi:hypothetical protein